MAIWLSGNSAGPLCTATPGVTRRRPVKGQTNPQPTTCRDKQSRTIMKTLLLGRGLKPGLKKRNVIIIGVILLVLLGVTIVLVCTHYEVLSPREEAKLGEGGPPNPEVPQPPSPSKERIFAKAAVCSDGPPCSAIGRDILARNGSAMDAAIATMFCNGIVNCHSMGLGGGFLMTYYKRDERKAYTLNAREKAPGLATPDMFIQPNASQQGALAVAVPGELKGMWEAHKKFGRLPWADLIHPAIKVCEEGYNMSQHQADALSSTTAIRNDTTLFDIFVDPDTGKFRRVGSLIKQKKYCETLKVIAEKGGDDLYTGGLAKKFADDIEEMGGIISKEDLRTYNVKWETPISVHLHDDQLYTVPPPGSGAILGFILNILNGYNFTSASVENINSTILTYHRIVEAYKYAFAKRTELGDGDFADITQLLKNLSSVEYASMIRRKIRDNSTDQFAKSYGAVLYNNEDHGTAHISVIAPNGDAVSLTSTINLHFGAKITSEQTGIILNSAMDDFSSPDFVNFFGLPGSPANAISPEKRPLSSMSPTIIVGKDGNVKMVVGASGGTKIPTSIAYVIMRNLWFGESIKEAIDASRFHHQLFPMEISYEFGMLDQVVKGLEKLGHRLTRYRDRGSIICGVTKKGNEIHANADFRKGGEVDGF